MDSTDPLSKKCSWTELKAVVNDLRREIAAISSLLPVQISFRSLPGGTMRIYYLVNNPDCWGIPLLFVDVPQLKGASETRLVGRHAMGCLPEALAAGAARRSREQQLLSERQRAPAWGVISSYQLHSANSCILFPMAGDLYLLDSIEGWSVPAALETGGSAALTPAMCPRRARLVAHAARGDLWLAGRPHGPLRLTYACRGSSRLADDPKQAGVPCYVMQEEFSRYTGFWWQPASNDDVYRILYEEVDESAVKIYSFPSYNSPNGETEEFRFPRAGSANARSTLRMVQFCVEGPDPDPGPPSPEYDLSDPWDSDPDIGRSRTRPRGPPITGLRWLDLAHPLEEVFPWLEYIARVGWTPCGQYVWCQLLDRRQQRLELVLIPLQNFSETFSYDQGPMSEPSPELSTQPEWQPIRVLMSDVAPDAWVNVHDILHFLPSEDPRQMSFIWASESSGHLHLYLITVDLTVPNDGIDVNPFSIGPNFLSQTILTSGNWEVIGRKIWVDEERELVYFVGLRETPLERHLYCTSYRHPKEPPRLLTQPGFSYTIDMDEKCTMVVATYSNIHTQPVCRVYSVCPCGHLSSLAARGSLPNAEPPLNDWDPDWRFWRDTLGARTPRVRSPSLSARYTPELYSTRLTGGVGEEVHAMLFRPAGVARTPRPTLLHVYGGPVVQTVTNTFKGMRQLRMHMVAARGYCVVCIDSRGSKHRGTQFEGRIRGRMGSVELADQIEVLKWLAEHTGCIDLNRVAVHGWSYGGYLSLMALAQFPELFKLCVACAPVTSWEMYDTAYTERYMDLPHLNPAGYARGSVLKHAERFPDQENRLLIVHGLQDENVHFLHTQQLVEALVRAGKPYQLQVYPNERHSLRHLEASAHYETTLLAFLQNNL